MNLRIANINDLDEVVGMAMKFLAVTNYKDYADEASVRELGTSILSSDGSSAVCLIHKDGGMIAGVVTPFLFGKRRVASELGWWVEPDKRKSNVGKELLEGFEFWAKTVHCDLITMVSLDDELGKFYEKCGYQLHERAYMKEI